MRFLLDLLCSEAGDGTVRAEVMTSLDGLTSDVVKLAGVSDDLNAVAQRHGRFGDHVAASRSQPYYLDITHPDANRGAVRRWHGRGDPITQPFTSHFAGLSGQ